MAAKGHSESRSKGSSGRRHEILGIFLLAFGLFSGLSMLAMHAGRTGMMGPGGAATAAGLYALFGMASYLVIFGMLALALRSFRGRSLVAGLTEGLGCLFLLGAVTVLLHLPFTGRAHATRGGSGPGGLMGEWLGELASGFIGPIGAALAATALLFVTLLLVTDIRMSEVVIVLGWATRAVRRGMWTGLCALGRLLVAMFPERHESESAPDDEEDEALVARQPRALLAELEDGERTRGRSPRDAALAIPMAMAADETDGVRVGDARAYSSEIEDPRAAMAAIVAEVAAVEDVPAAPASSFEPVPADQGDVDVHAAADDEEAEPYVIEERPAVALVPNHQAEPASAAGPIIVEPAWRTRLREREQASKDAAKDAAARKADAADGPSFIKLKDGAYQLPNTELLEYLPPQGNDTDKQALYEMAERLEQAMSNYGVRGKVKEIHMGPVVTMFEFAPAPGTRTGKIANL